MNEEEYTYKERWDKAIKWARKMLVVYEKLPDGVGAFGAMTIKMDIDLYDAGDHSEALLERIEAIK